MFDQFLQYFRKQIIQLKLQKRYPNCKFYPGVVVDNCNFGGFNVLFKDVVVSNCSLGAHTYVQKKSTIFNADIGKYCSIASFVSVAPGLHKANSVSTHPSFYLKNTPLLKVYVKEDLFPTSARVTIGHDVWIGESAIIMDGINIGNGVIIGAGAVVTKDVENYAIVGGVPAKLIKYRFDNETKEKLLEFKWWNKSEEWIELNHQKFLNSEFLLNEREE
jgi:acetyltransferase-like isoleucine patch superfamily enzyme